MYEIKLNPDNKIFWKYCKEKKLAFQKCSDCGKVRWPYSIACPECHSFNYEIIFSSGKGIIYSYVVYNVPFDKEFKDKVPYVVGIIELEEGVRILSNIVESSFEKIECGKKVKLIWDDYIPKFKLE